MKVSFKGGRRGRVGGGGGGRWGTRPPLPEFSGSTSVNDNDAEGSADDIRITPLFRDLFFRLSHA